MDKACETIWEAMSQVMEQKDAGKTPTQKDAELQFVLQHLALGPLGVGPGPGSRRN